MDLPCKASASQPDSPLPRHVFHHSHICHLLWCLLLCLQDLYVSLPVPEPLKSGENAASFAFLEKELRFSQM